MLLQLSQFFPLRPPPPSLPSTPVVLTLLPMSMDPSCTFFDQSLPLLSISPCLPLPHLQLSVYSVFLCLWFCFAHQIPFINELIWYLSFTAWLISLSMIVSSSNHAVTKGRNSCFLLLCSIPLCFLIHLLIGMQALSNPWLL